MKETGKSRIHFRRVDTVPQFRLRNDTLEDVSDYSVCRGRMTITFTPLSTSSGERTETSRAEVTLSTRAPKPYIAAILESTTRNRFPNSEELLTAVALSKALVPWEQQAVIMMESMPSPFQDYARNTAATMDSGLERFVALVRWRHVQWGPPRAIECAEPIQWSTDGDTWYYLPFTVKSSLKTEVTLDFDEVRRNEIVERFDNTLLTEPVYRELLRESDQLQNSSRRSSLILAVAAAEIAVKRVIYELKPDWYGIGLLEGNAPPAETIYSDLATLPIKNTIDGRAVGPPARILSELKKAVSARNGLVHAGADPIDRDSLIVKFNAIRDLILLVDYYLGYSWAFEQLTYLTKSELREGALGETLGTES